MTTLVEQKNKDLKEIAQEVRNEFKVAFPKCTFSVTIERYSGGQSMTVALMKAPFDAILFDRVREFEDFKEIFKEIPPVKQSSQLNHHYIEPHKYGYISNGAILSKECGEVMQRVVKIANYRNWNRSDSQTDYFDVNYYFHLEIGRWNKPFTKTGGVQ